MNRASADRPLVGRRVALFRAAGQIDDLGRALESLGAEPIAVPLIAVTEPADGGAALSRALGEVERYDWIVITSANGARAIAALARDDGGDGDGPPWALAAVGRATAAALARSGLVVGFVPTVATAETLAAELPTRGANRVLAPLAELAGPDLATGLAARGFEVDRVDAYRLTDVEPTADQRAAVGNADALVFTSPSIVDRYRACGFAPGRSAIISIGPRTTRRLRAAGLDPVHEASPHDGDGIVQALVAALDHGPTS